MVWLQEPDRSLALALEGAAPFDPIGDGRARSAKVMLPDWVMVEPAQLRRWVTRAFEGAASLPPRYRRRGRGSLATASNCDLKGALGGPGELRRQAF